MENAPKPIPQETMSTSEVRRSGICLWNGKRLPDRTEYPSRLLTEKEDEGITQRLFAPQLFDIEVTQSEDEEGGEDESQHRYALMEASCGEEQHQNHCHNKAGTGG